ncbi:hypothetical protein GGR42_000553 [Saonia flava]|uniref:TonB-dependent receptor plug domain-containing protein n=1 Tax=Saonia flava TaxID=523696 RepID=A0A846QPT7_9FLAO|nr:carboxypeptidase-like regulatory domain-containing protein [Saonia flava]NJB70091.1 hypothetical protein [Saonia flava]
MKINHVIHNFYKHFFLFLLFALCFNFSLAQSDSTRITLVVENESLKNVIDSLETKTNATFFYLEEWFGDELISIAFENETLPVVLEELLSKTELNFYILDGDKVILTKNNIIYDELPNNFFIKRDSSSILTTAGTDQRQLRPIFYSDRLVANDNRVQKIQVGKASKEVKTSLAKISGVAINASNGLPIPDLVVQIKNQNIRTTTDETGYYELELPYGINRMNTRALGIEDATFELYVYNSGTVDLALNEGLEQLDEVVLEADAFRNVEEATTGSAQIDSEESKNIPLVLGERDILQVARNLPGISSAGEGAAGFNVRGGKTDQNLILLDDATIYNPSHFFGIFQALNPYTTKGVDIYKGNVPAKFGGRLSSVFDIQSKEGNTEKFSGEASIGPVTSNIALEVPMKKEESSLLLGGRGTYSDWILKSLDEPDLANSSANFYDVIAKYDHKISDKHSISAMGYYSKDAFSITSDSLYKYSNRLFSLKWKHAYSEKNRGDLILSNSNYQFNIDYDGEANTDFLLGYKVNETELKYNLRYLYNSKHTFDYGIASKLYVVEPGSIEPSGSDSSIEARAVDQEKGLESAIYISDAYKVNDKLLIDAGFRLSLFTALGASTQNIYQEGEPRNDGSRTGSEEYGEYEFIKTYIGPEARFSTRYLFTPTFSIKGSVNSGYQYIHTLSNNTTVSPIDTWKLSDLNIKPQQGYQYALGLYKNSEDNMYEYSLEGYYKQFKNAIDFKTGAQLLLNENIETEVLQGDGKAYGVELLLRKNTGKLNGWLGYTYSRSFLKFDSEYADERINNGEYFSSNYDKPHDLSLVTNYKFTKRYSVSANFVYQTGRPVTYPIGTYRFNNADYVYYSNRNEFRIPDYYRLDLGLNIEGNHKIKKFAHSFWTISVYNVLGRNNPYSVFFVTENGEVKAYQSSIFSIPVPSITYNFKF